MSPSTAPCPPTPQAPYAYEMPRAPYEAGCACTTPPPPPPPHTHYAYGPPPGMGERGYNGRFAQAYPAACARGIHAWGTSFSARRPMRMTRAVEAESDGGSIGMSGGGGGGINGVSMAHTDDAATKLSDRVRRRRRDEHVEKE
ncbi:hypothetical protein FB451DRAFT_1397848 [Mycena latifolia]|nr:hypothetical protein FB451DRAFT_1397848 [Mycena latifolia]